MATAKKKRTRAANSRGWHTVTVNFSRDEMAVLQRVAKLAGVKIATLLRVVLALRVASALPVLAGPRK